MFYVTLNDEKKEFEAQSYMFPSFQINTHKKRMAVPPSNKIPGTAPLNQIHNKMNWALSLAILHPPTCFTEIHLVFIL